MPSHKVYVPVQPPRPDGPRVGVVWAFLVGIVVFVVGGIWVLVPGAPFKSNKALWSGSMTVVGSTYATVCTSSRYPDIHDGTQVTVTDPAGTVVAVTQLESGELANGGACFFTFTSADTPMGKKFYGIEVAHRGVVRFTEEQLMLGPRLTLGD